MMNKGRENKAPEGSSGQGMATLIPGAFSALPEPAGENSDST